MPLFQLDPYPASDILYVALGEGLSTSLTGGTKPRSGVKPDATPKANEKSRACTGFFIWGGRALMATMFGELSIETIIITLGYIGIIGMMVSNGIVGLPSSQILYIIAGFFIFTGELNLLLVVTLGAIGNTIGNIILYELSRRRGLVYISRFKIFPEREVRKVQAVFDKHGGWFVFVGKLLPAIKVFIPIVVGIGKMNRALYTPIILVSSILWSLIFISIGYFFGKNTDFLGYYGFILIVVALIVVGVFYRYMNSSKILKEIEIKE